MGLQINLGKRRKIVGFRACLASVFKWLKMFLEKMFLDSKTFKVFPAKNTSYMLLAESTSNVFFFRINLYLY